MPPKVVTLQDVEELREVSPKRRRFSDNPVVYKREDGRYVVSTRFDSIDRLFENETGIATVSGPHGPYKFLSEGEFRVAQEWQSKRLHLVSSGTCLIAR